MNSRSKSLLAAVVAVGAALCSTAEVKTLVWNGSAEAGNEWNRVALNWLDGETPTTWIDGSDARFVRDGDTAFVREPFLVRQMSVAQNVSVKPVLTGAASGVDTSAAPFDGERGLAWGSTFNSTSNWTVIWRNRRLSTIEEIVGAKINKGSYPNGRGYFYAYDAATDTATVQIQPDYYTDGQMVATDVKFRQNGDNIEAICLASDYDSRSKDSANYHDRVTIRGAVDTPYSVGNFLASTKGGKLLIARGGGLSRISGMKIGVRIDDGGMDTKNKAAEGQRQLNWDTWIPSTSWVTIWKNRRLSNILGIGYADFDGSSDPAGKGYGWKYYPETDTAWVQIQPDFASNKQMWGCNLAFRQNGDDIQVIMTNAYCYGGATSGTPSYHDIVAEHSSGTRRQARRLLAVSGVGNLPISYSGTNLNANVVMRSSSASPTKIWEDTRLADLVAVYGTQNSSSDDLADVPVAFVNNGTTATVQLQRLCAQQTTTTDGLITYLNLEFTRVDADVYVRVNYARYRWYYKTNIATDPLVFPDTRLPTTGTGGSNYYTQPGWITGYFKSATIAAPIDDISKAPTLKGGGLTFSGADMGDGAFNFAWPLNVSSKYMPIAFTNNVKAVFPESLTNKVAVAQFSGATTLTLPTDAAFEVGNAEIGEGASFVIDADIDAKPVRIGTTRCLSIAELAAFSTSQGDLLSQDSAGYLVPRKGIFILVK